MQRPSGLQKQPKLCWKIKMLMPYWYCLTPQAMTAPTETAEAIAEMASKTSKTIMAGWLGGASMREGIQVFNNAGIANYSTPEQAIHSIYDSVRLCKKPENAL
jgi:acyl-CoA synthetase (NDP forming)